MIDYYFQIGVSVWTFGDVKIDSVKSESTTYNSDGTISLEIQSAKIVPIYKLVGQIVPTKKAFDVVDEFGNKVRHEQNLTIKINSASEDSYCGEFTTVSISCSIELRGQIK